LASAELERVGVDDSQYQSGEPIATLLGLGNDFAEEDVIGGLEASSQGVGEQLLRQTAAKLIGLLQ
jgi:hypothetical protein